MLTKKQLKDLRNNITLNSLFLKDYENWYYIKPQSVCNFFNSFLDYIDNEYNFDNMDLYDLLEQHDNIDEIYDYYIESCVDGYDPLSPDNYIAYYNDGIFAGVLLYDIEYGIDDYAIVASYYMNKYNVMVINKITKNKIYYDGNGDSYIKKYNRRYLLKDFIKEVIK